MRPFGYAASAAALAVAATVFALAQKPAQKGTAPAVEPVGPRVHKTEAEWRRLLTPQQFAVLRQQDTERAFTGRYDHFFGKGVYRCAACGNELFSSANKFDSGTGWPSFWAPIAKDHVTTREDRSDGDIRTEVLCAKCGGHLGHVFEDGPRPTGLRYCMNSVALRFQPTK